MKHSPLPWEAESFPNTEKRIKNGNWLADAAGYALTGRYGEVTQSDAAFIVKACNSYYPMREAMRGLQSATPTGEFVNWVADRLTFRYGDSENVDFIHRLRDMAEAGAKIDKLLAKGADDE